jgi:hypothetical protein
VVVSGFFGLSVFLNCSCDRCLQQPQQDQDEEMLVPHQDIVEGPQPMEGENFRLLLWGFLSTIVALSCPTIFHLVHGDAAEVITLL